MLTIREPALYDETDDSDPMAIIVEDHVGGRKISYDLVKFHRFLTETLVKKGILSSKEIAALYKRSQ